MGSILRTAGAAILVLALVLIGAAIGANFWPRVANVERRVVDPVRLVASRRSDLETVPDTVDQSCPAIVLLRRPGSQTASATPESARKARRSHRKSAAAPAQAVGFFVTPDGYLLTAASAFPDGPVEVVLSDGRVLAATREAVDPLAGLALFKVEESDLPILQFADDGFPRIGQTGLVVVPTGTTGCLAGLVFIGSDFVNENEGLRSYVLLQDRLDPDWPGVPILDFRGRVIGIGGLTSRSDDEKAAKSVLPGSTANHVADRLVRDGVSPRNRFGFETEDLGPTIGNRLGYDRGGALVSLVDAGSDADEAGLKAGDIVVAINGQPVSSASELARAIDAQGRDFSVRIQRRGQLQQVTLLQTK